LHKLQSLFQKTNLFIILLGRTARSAKCLG
jgi:hypothetical protein